MSDKELVSATITALAAIDAELGLPEDGCNSTARTLTAIRLLHSVHRDDVAEIERLHEQMERGTAALRVAFGEELWRLGHPAYVVVHLREEIEKVTRLWKAATVERDALRASLASAEAEVARLTAEQDAISANIGGNEYLDPPDGGNVSLAEQVRRMRADILALREQIAALESREVCTVAHDNVETCGYCQRDALLARVEAAEKDAARAREFLLAFINGGANQDFRLWARELYAAMREGGK